MADSSLGKKRLHVGVAISFDFKAEKSNRMPKIQPIHFYPSKPNSGLLTDSFQRVLNYLRISVTDRCNMRCDYCRPASNDYHSESHDNILRYEEIERIVQIAASLGVNKIRITGGEPLVRRDLPLLIEKLAAIDGITELTMTSNASLLARYANDLANAGLNRVNISLDSLNPLRFRTLTGGKLSPVLAGIEAAIKAGLTPIKLNTVLMRGINDHDVAELIDFAGDHGATIRFIELMPMKQGMNWDTHYISMDEILRRDDVQQRVNTASILTTGHSAARYLPRKNGTGTVGFIMPMSEKFCEGCNRLRLTANGGLRACLPADKQFNLRDLMRRGGSDDDIRAVFLRTAQVKPEIGVYDFSSKNNKRSMIHIGG